MVSPKLDLLKKAAIYVIETLRSDDQVAVVSFSTTAHVIGDTDGSMLSASSKNMAYLVQAINNLETSGGSNYLAALEQAFNTLNQTITAELSLPCNSAILFLADGESN